MPRKSELSFLNIVFCILVIFIHISSAPITGLSKDSWQFCVFFVPWRLSSFVVQGFIFLSGLKMFLNEKEVSYKNYYIQRFFKIVIPYILAVIAYYVYFIDRNYFQFSIKDLISYILKGDLVAHFYFIIAIVQFYLLKPVWDIVVNKVSPKIVIPLSIILMFTCKYMLSAYWYNDRLFTSYLAYWIMGCYAGKYYKYFLSNVKRCSKIYLVAFVIIATLEAVISYTHFVYGGMSFLEELHFLYCIVAVLFVFLLAIKYADKIMSWKIAREFDNASYYIYLIHILIMLFINEFIVKWNITDIGVSFVIRGIVTYFVATFISITYMETKKKIKRKIKCRSLEKQR